MSEEEDHLPFKLVLLGESAVGKSSLVLRFVKGEFSDQQLSTIGAAFLSKVVDTGDEKIMKFDIWDTAGQERYRSLAPMYYRGASAALIVYDITSYDSYEKAKVWIKEIKLQGERDTVIALTGNKLDLGDRRDVQKSEADAYSEENDILFTETSAKTGENVDDIFLKIAKILIGKQVKHDRNPLQTTLSCDSGKCGTCPSCISHQGDLEKNNCC